VRRRRRT
jgi:hypothetical protein